MGLIVCPDSNKAAVCLADHLQQALIEKPDLCLGLAAGSTSGLAYCELVRRYHTNKNLTFRYATSFNTDEFLEISPDDPRSVRYFMNTSLFKLVDFPLEHTHVPRGDVPDPDQECRAYDALIKARGGLDLVVLGLGHNGHIGFNEPGSTARSRTRVVGFTESTMAALSDGRRFHNLDETPSAALTMGLSTILQSRHILLIATGIGKRLAVHKMFDCKPGSNLPASHLLNHPRLTVIVDRDAAAALKSPSMEVTYVADARLD